MKILVVSTAPLPKSVEAVCSTWKDTQKIHLSDNLDFDAIELGLSTLKIEWSKFDIIIIVDATPLMRRVKPRLNRKNLLIGVIREGLPTCALGAGASACFGPEDTGQLIQYIKSR